MEPEARDLVQRALAEDIGAGDVTADAVVPAYARARGRIDQKQDGAVFGLGVAEEVFRQAGAPTFERLCAEGEWRSAPAGVCVAEGSARQVLAAERTALNFLGHLSGIATLTARYVRAVEGTTATILDTRKTTPGMRVLEKAAVAAGGGTNHRMGLHDGILIKENHAVTAGGIGAAVKAARDAQPGRQIEVECRDAVEVGAALDAGAPRILLDNMGPDELRAAVTARDAAAEAGGVIAELEASGGITLDNVADVARTGVDFISVGALTHSAPALDLSMTLQPE